MRTLALTLWLMATPAAADLYEVTMLNRNDTGGMVFEPDYLRLQPGDRVKFLATHATHNAATIAQMLPPGAQTFKGQINEEIEVTFTVPGIYGVKCIPHYMMGMVMLIEVGDGSSAGASLPADMPPDMPQDMPEQAKTRFNEIIARHEVGARN